ncbi:hypothetical protein Scep_007743 [Stephania cephalantha]|uniref:Uncharacterized protein n=1 Tax=Stephania cephalantha TaxID=152367 RepID=A0AAP0KAG1_9MAGN
MASESFGSTRTGVSVASSTSSQSVGDSGGDWRRKRFRLLRQRDRAQSVGSVASPPYAAHTTPVSVGIAQSYASTPPQPAPSGPHHQYYQRTDKRGSGQRQGQSSNQVQRQGQRPS